MKPRLLAILIVLALALRVLFWLEIVGLHAPLRGDEIDYDRIARSLASGCGFVGVGGEPTASRPPLYPVVLAGIYRIFGPHEAAGRILQILLGGAIVGLTYLLARRLVPERAALAAAALAACAPPLVFISAYLLSENLYVVLLLSFLIVFSKSFETEIGYGSSVAGGILLGLASLERPNAFPFALFAAAAYVAWGVGALRARLPRVALLLAVLLAVLAPWAIRNEARLGKPVLFTTHGGITFYQGNNRIVSEEPTYRGTVAPLEALPGWDDIKVKGEVAGDAEAWRLGKEFVREHPRLALKMAGWRLARFWRLTGDAGFSGVKSGWWWDRGKSLGSLASSFDFVFAYSIVAIPLSVIGLILTLRRARSFVLLYGIVLVHTVTALVFFGSLRSRIPVEPVIAILAGFAALRIFGAIRAHLAR
ncbi:MAG: glycosyltransferase family 39 protein [Candidatus Krumholzibacteriaceae bacterium]|jgi:4-amino-4-deoxy-L-arabinose transferase-like glycosyltransferase